MSGSESPSGTACDFTIRLLGGFGVFYRSSALSVPRASQRLLAFLALHGPTVGRAVVAGTLWPDASESRAHSNLRSALSRIQTEARKALATSKFELGLAERVTVDIHYAEALARRLLDPAATPDPSRLSTAAITALSANLSASGSGSLGPFGASWSASAKLSNGSVDLIPPPPDVIRITNCRLNYSLSVNISVDLSFLNFCLPRICVTIPFIGRVCTPKICITFRPPPSRSATPAF